MCGWFLCVCLCVWARESIYDTKYGIGDTINNLNDAINGTGNTILLNFAIAKKF